MKQRGNALLNEARFIESPSPSQQAKNAGCASLKEVSIMTGASEQTLINWHKNKPQLFAIVLTGCARSVETGL